ncbi:hypothetical protein ACFV4M_17915, partial [Kitasatospora indigofera]
IPTLPAAGSDTTAVSDRELAMAQQLVDMLAVDWNPENYRDTFEQKVHELIAAKQSGQEITAPEAAPTPSNVLDLMDILGRSLESAKTASTPATGAAKAGAKSAAATAKNSRTGTGSKAGAAAGRTSAGHQPKDTGAKKSTSTRTTRPATSATGKKTGTAAGRRKEDLSGLTKSELYKKATAAHLPHRSTMTRDELQNALEKTGHGRHLHSAS